MRLRGAPLLLSPVDWEVARRWRREGIPLEVARRGIEDVFERRRARGARGRMSSLRYCMPAVEAAWAAHSELTAPGGRVESEPFDTRARLEALAAALPALPDALAGGDDLRRQLRDLALSDLDAQVVEERLAGLDRRVLDAALAALSPADRAALDAAAEKTLAALSGRLPAGEIERARDRLASQILRRRLDLPTLSLFSPEATPSAAPPAAEGEALPAAEGEGRPAAEGAIEDGGQPSSAAGEPEAT